MNLRVNTISIAFKYRYLDAEIARIAEKRRARTDGHAFVTIAAGGAIYAYRFVPLRNRDGAPVVAEESQKAVNVYLGTVYRTRNLDSDVCLTFTASDAECCRAYTFIQHRQRDPQIFSIMERTCLTFAADVCGVAGVNLSEIGGLNRDIVLPPDLSCVVEKLGTQLTQQSNTLWGGVFEGREAMIRFSDERIVPLAMRRALAKASFPPLLIPQPSLPVVAMA